jgi:hypothetical protein
MALRDEIATLHAQDNTEAEYVELLRNHHLLRLVIDDAFDPETAAKIHPVSEGEYKMFLNKEAMDGANINPMILEHITAREIAAGRMDPDNSLRKLAVAGAAVLGDSDATTPDGRNAIGGGATIGFFVGLGMKFFMTGATWWTVGKAVLIGAAIGFVLELLPRLFALVTRRA